MVPVGEYAPVAMALEVSSQPPPLSRAGVETAGSVRVGVERDQVPGADVERVVVVIELACSAAEVGAVGGGGLVGGAALLVGPAAEVLVIADHRVDPRLESAPEPVERRRPLVGVAVLVLEVS